jgi:3-methyladenine DNA glycosylase AlkD
MARIEAERSRAASEIEDQFNKEENESFGSDEDMNKTIVENELEESVII